ncbi:hypothetical protein [Halopseudomonas sp.]
MKRSAPWSPDVVGDTTGIEEWHYLATLQIANKGIGVYGLE